jgi:4-hydroxybenzoate polyprenyltransferase
VVSRAPRGGPTGERWQPPPLGGAAGGPRAGEAPALTLAGRGTAYLRLLRPHHWTKNLACLAGAFFSGRFVDPGALAGAFWTFAVFCAAASAVYAVNDVLDRDRDRQHPWKRDRPVASGAVGAPAALAVGVVLAAVGLGGAWKLGPGVLVCMLLYVANNLAYSMSLKHLILFDVLSIALGFVLRLLAGVYVVGELPTTWITLCSLFLALFLAVGKRRAELRTLGSEGPDRRPVLSRYTVAYLDSLLDSSAVMAIMCYALFTTSADRDPSLVIGVPIVFYAIMHYKRLVMLSDASEEPEQILLRDPAILVSVVLWLASYLMIERGHFRLFR